jgi:hypothetical protein
MMHGPINVKSPTNISKWQMGFNSEFKGLIYIVHLVGYFYSCITMHGFMNVKIIELFIDLRTWILLQNS